MPSLASVLGFLGIAAFLVLAVLPVVNRRSKTPAIYTQCASRLHTIDWAIRAYRVDHRDHFPTELMSLVPRYLPTDDGFLLPRHEPTPGLWIDDASARAADQMDYIYLGEGLQGDARNAGPIVIERRSIHRDGMRLVWNGDGSIDKLDLPDILKRLEPLRGTPRLTQEEYDALTAK